MSGSWRAGWLLVGMLAVPVLAAAAPAQGVTLTLPNQDSSSPACVASLLAEPGQCAGNRCELPLPKGSPASSYTLHLSCIPGGSLTGIERPPPGSWEEAVRAGDVNVNILMGNGDAGTPEAGTRWMSFCFITLDAYFCGATTLPRMKAPQRRAASAAVKSFIRDIRLLAPSRLPSTTTPPSGTRD